MNQRLCFVVTSSVTATTFLRGYLAFLREDGWDVTLICGDGPGASELASSAGVGFAPVPMTREPAPLADCLSVLRMYRVLRRIRPGTLVYATPKASLVAAIAGRIAGVPRRVYELWGLRLETAGGLSRRVFSAIESLTARLSTLVIANSRSLAERSLQLGVDGGKVPVVLGQGSSHGVDSHYFSTATNFPRLSDVIRSEIQRQGAPVIGFVGRLHPDKGIDTLLDALNILEKRGLNAQLLIVGADEGARLDDQLVKLTRHVPVHVLGYMADVRGALEQMQILVLPSRREGFPNVVLEAAAMSVPAVVSDATGCRDSVVDGETGLVFTTGDERALADALENLVLNLEVRRDMGRAARSRAIEHFSPPAIWQAHSAAWRGTNEAHLRGDAPL